MPMSISVAAGTSEATVPVRGAVEAGQLDEPPRSHPQTLISAMSNPRRKMSGSRAGR
jgi:hypothetical protein